MSIVASKQIVFKVKRWNTEEYFYLALASIEAMSIDESDRGSSRIVLNSGQVVDVDYADAKRIAKIWLTGKKLTLISEPILTED